MNYTISLCNQAYANIPQKYTPLAMAGAILVAKGPINNSEESTALFCEVEKIKAFILKEMVDAKEN